MIEGLARAARTSLADLDAAWAERLLDAFTADLQGSARGVFAATFEEILRDVAGAGATSTPGTTCSPSCGAAPCPASQATPSCARAEDLFQELRLAIGEAAEGAQAQHRLEVQRWARLLSETSEALVTAEGVAAMVKAVAEHFPRLSIPSAFLSLYEPGAAPFATSRLLLAYDTARPAELAPTSRTFASRELAPAGVLPKERRAAFVLEPLFFHEEQLGFVLLEMGPRAGAVYEALRDQISAALTATLLMARIVARIASARCCSPTSRSAPASSSAPTAPSARTRRSSSPQRSSPRSVGSPRASSTR